MPPQSVWGKRLQDINFKPRFLGGKTINGRTIVGPVFALTMVGLFFVYSRVSVQAAKKNAERHRVADGGQISWYVCLNQASPYSFADKISSMWIPSPYLPNLLSNANVWYIVDARSRYNENQRRHGALQRPEGGNLFAQLFVNTKPETPKDARKSDRRPEEEQILKAKNNSRKEECP